MVNPYDIFLIIIPPLSYVRRETVVRKSLYERGRRNREKKRRGEREKEGERRKKMLTWIFVIYS